MIYEMRTYRCLPGRLPALLQRFERHTLGFWERYGIRQAGFWTTIIGESNQELIYLLEWQSLAEREEKWTAFASDPAWHEVVKQSEADGRIVANVSNTILQPTAFSSVR